MKEDAPVDAPANRLAVVEVKTHCEKLAKVDAEALVDTMANKLAQVKIESLT